MCDLLLWKSLILSRPCLSLNEMTFPMKTKTCTTTFEWRRAKLSGLIIWFATI